MKIQISIKCLAIVYLLAYQSFLFTDEAHSLTENAVSIRPIPSIKTPNKGIDIKKVMDYQMPHVIARYCKDYKVSADTAKIHEVELKRWLILAGDGNEGDSLGMMSKEVDNLWHTFLLFTKEYHAFCNDMFGKFIHHCPEIEEV